jgi:hypothetical protein
VRRQLSVIWRFDLPSVLGATSLFDSELCWSFTVEIRRLMVAEILLKADSKVRVYYFYGPAQ